MNYKEIFKKAFEITIKNKFLWIFGIFLSISQIFNFNAEKKPAFLSGLPQGKTAAIDQIWAKIQSFDFTALLGNPWFILTLILFILALIYLGTVAHSALISAADKIDQGEKTDFKQNFKIGNQYFWPMIGLEIICLVAGSALFTFLLIIAVIIAIAGIISGKAVLLGILVIALLGLIFLASLIYLSLVQQYAKRFLVLKNYPVFKAWWESFSFIWKNLGKLLAVLGLIILVTIGFSVALVIFSLILAFVVALLFVLVSSFNLILAIILGIILAIAILAIYVAFLAGFTVFGSVVLTLVFKKLA